MKVEMSVPEAVSLFKEIQQQPEKLFERIRMDIRDNVGQYLSKLMEMELTHFLGRKPYERREQKDPNHRNGSYDRNVTLKGIGPVEVEVPRDRKGAFKTQVIARSKRYEDDLRQGLCLMFLTNVLAKVPRKLKQAVADGMRNIFYASTKEKAKEFFSEFKQRWEKELPSAVKCLESALEACLTFFNFPQEEWISLRTTNIIERLNKEFKRRTKPMEIIAGEQA